ncbi:transcriptional regulator [Wenjunlia vitaminophila]|uniref:Transcriptional regulator n=1 Tax=Wenjunlia vitaminophila TaxID=76728 RepID=A0A0T6LQI8_WENVI|nr:helix-turn-helix domain-containing protein [Wenjunlia vitaminophila]KRV48326.1 transcriptional regulator [Wenjunlia vitaminophila]
MPRTEQEGLFAAVDALLEQAAGVLPPPAERVRLRQAGSLTQTEVARALKVRRETVADWEAGRKEPRPPKRAAYVRLLEGLAARFPAAQPADPPEAPTGSAAVPPPATTPDPAESTATDEASHPESSDTARRSPAPRRPANQAAPASTAAPAPTDQRFRHGPLGVLDGDGTLYCAGGTVLTCPATTLPALVEWTLAESGLGAPRLHRHGRDSDPLIVITASAAQRLGLPPHLEDRRGLRLPDDHPVVRQLARRQWKLTRRGFGPWARVYRPVPAGGQRQCVQLAVLPWDALDARAWSNATELHPADLARALAVYATRVLTPRGSTAVTGLELMTALRPPTRAVRDEASGGWGSGPNPGALTCPVDPAPPEATPEHPVAQGWPKDQFLDEEAYQWVRDPALLDDAECLLPHAVGIDINTAFLAAASRLAVGIGGPAHVTRPAFDKKLPGCWLVDLSGIDLDPRLPSPFTSSGQRPTGPAWYATPTVAYAAELGHAVDPVEAYLRHETGAYLDPWHDRLRTAYLATMADLGVPTDRDVDERAFLAAMEQHRETDPATACVLSAVKSTVKGGIGKLRERPQGRGYRDGQRWPALERPTWRPDIRAAVISKARVNMHRKMANVAKATGRYPLAVLSDCVVYPSPGRSPLDFLPLTPEGRVLPGTFRLGANPGAAKLEGVQDMAWAVDLMEQGHNPARHIKGGDAVLDEGE